MRIRGAMEKDFDRIIILLQQVLEIHAAIRPDIFRSGTTKYTKEQLSEILADGNRPIYVAVDDADDLMGYAFCVLKETPAESNNMVRYKQLYIDDLCVDASARGQHVGEALFEHVKEQARAMGCYEVSLCVWAGNDGAERFYEKMGLKTKERIMEYIL